MKDSYLAQFYGKSQNYTDIPNKWYKEYNVKKGLRNEDGTGVRIGLTRVADVVGYEDEVVLLCPFCVFFQVEWSVFQPVL